MAYTMKLGFADLPTIYNITNAVGRGQVSWRDDVMLVNPQSFKRRGLCLLTRFKLRFQP
ncbi:hypothetical protein GCM10027577_10330 [Spirosoma fluminis]